MLGFIFICSSLKVWSSNQIHFPSAANSQYLQGSTFSSSRSIHVKGLHWSCWLYLRYRQLRTYLSGCTLPGNSTWESHSNLVACSFPSHSVAPNRSHFCFGPYHWIMLSSILFIFIFSLIIFFTSLHFFTYHKDTSSKIKIPTKVFLV